MSFQCTICRKSTKNNVKPVRIITETRIKKYPTYRTDTFGGTHQVTGVETVREEMCCPGCAGQITSMSAEPVAADVLFGQKIA